MIKFLKKIQQQQVKSNGLLEQWVRTDAMDRGIKKAASSRVPRHEIEA